MNKKTLVLGASLKPERYSNMVIQRLVNSGNTVVAFGLKEGTVSGVQIETKLKHYKDIHSVSLYLNPLRQEMYFDYIVSLSPKRVIFNPGTENPVLQELLDQHEIAYEVACTLVLLGTKQY